MANPLPGRSQEPQSPRRAASNISEEIATVSAQQRETLALVRQLIEMLLPKGDPDKPKLEDLIAALVGQQGKILLILRQLSLDMKALLERGPEDGKGRLREHRLGNAETRP